MSTVQMSSHPEMSAPTATAPATARSTKPTATVSTSRMTRCLSQTEYAVRSTP